MSKDVLTLGIETSCDETSAAVVLNGRKVLSNIIFSQIEAHQKFGGVVPELASRAHLEKICYVVEEALKKANLSIKDIDVIAVTNRPGLIGALLVGVSYAKGLSYAAKKPLVGVNHIAGHIYANFLETNFSPPFLCLVVSGGHSHLFWVEDYGKFKILGKTIDDAAGEAFDKVARALGLGYPGGPAIQKAAESGNEDSITFPVAQIKGSELDFSFSGLKTAVLNYLNQQKQKGIKIKTEDVAASFQKAVVKALVENTRQAILQIKTDTLALAGGVAANKRLRQEFSKLSQELGIKVHFPPVEFCTDNAAMIACAGYYSFLDGKVSDFSLDAYAVSDF
ncbi:tRNA (adenosine(37)-N6)-threonylcarbamoyltransferase complex transferase subunit TsaD [Thermovenabulum gondwanense]|uniref:tRNA N6-adenosine threonylcarbamoyltransferase n=1 Tax=Thermovenabulum gondwanense TaxID=520767 RepID=A0A162MPA5_9FIRM|nr:tRNA (adenosine(37)-N6)-threonylcarbamoyltransferase complex transferase subunit TsaD [Thermovenabulum gondwanense]KYO66846.1 tRNA N6-adenosine threonylcarbamoyltransferase [Thermovenabulum gondwanense]